MVSKGKISSLSNGKATVIPYDAGSAVTFPLMIPDALKDILRVRDNVLYTMFEDNTGVIVGLAE